MWLKTVKKLPKLGESSLVGGAITNHLEKYESEFVNGKDDIPYMKWKRKVMFETTNQASCHLWIKHEVPSGKLIVCY